jgi:ABC-type lipoprotein release transport system permease subunit
MRAAGKAQRRRNGSVISRRRNAAGGAQARSNTTEFHCDRCRGGVIAALALAGRIEPLLFEIPPRDPVTFVVVLTLHIVAALASSIPAWKASRVDPNIALRAD